MKSVFLLLVGIGLMLLSGYQLEIAKNMALGALTLGAGMLCAILAGAAR